MSRLLPEYVCEGFDSNYYTEEIYLNKGLLRITNRINLSSERCESGYRAKREEIQTCTASLNELDDFVVFGSGTSAPLVIKCLTGDCFNCVEQSKAKNRLQDWRSDSRKFGYYSADVYVGGEDYVRDHEGKFKGRFKDFVRALVRLIAGGSDDAFCQERPRYC